MEYAVQAFKVLKNLVHVEKAQKTGYFVAFLTKTRFLCVITNNFMHVWIFALIRT